MKYLLVTFFLCFSFPSNFAFAAENEEIEYLLSFIAASDCVFIRNGTEHPPKEASEHLEMKYNHVKKRIKTADVFIKKIASKSSITRRKYQVHCRGEQFPTEQWLERALASYRISAGYQEIKGEK